MYRFLLLFLVFQKNRLSLVLVLLMGFSFLKGEKERFGFRCFLSVRYVSDLFLFGLQFKTDEDSWKESDQLIAIEELVK